MNLSRSLLSVGVGVCLCASSQAADGIDLRAYSLAQNYHYSWDPVAKNAVVEGPGGRFQFHVGSEYFLKDGHLARMDGKAIFLQDSVVMPSSAASFLPAPASAPRMPAAVPAIAETVPPAFHRLRKVVIDAGHGGKDDGATSRYGLKEKRVVLEVANKVKRGLESAGIQVIMTRGADVFIPLSERARIANKNSADLFVSIHANASTTPSLNGFEVYTLSEATDDQALAVERTENSVIRFEPGAHASLSNNLKTILWELKETENRKESLHASQHISTRVVAAVATAAKRQKSANFYVLKWTECPAVLVELAYLSNRTDERRLRDPVYRTQIADAIVQGLLDYRKEFESTNGYTA